MVCGGQLRHFDGHHGGCACHMTHGVAYDGQSREVRVMCMLEGCAGEKAQGGAIFNVKAYMKVIDMVCGGQLRLLWWPPY